MSLNQLYFGQIEILVNLRTIRIFTLTFYTSFLEFLFLFIFKLYKFRNKHFNIVGVINNFLNNVLIVYHFSIALNF